MENNEKNPARPENQGRSEGRSEGAGEGKRSRGGHGHNRGRNHNRNQNRNQNPGKADKIEKADKTDKAEKADKSDKNGGAKGNTNQKPSSNGTSQPSAENRGNRPQGESKAAPKAAPRAQEPRESREAQDVRSENRDAQPQQAPAESRRQPPSTGRPQRAPRRAPAQADLPDMENLLIDDNMNSQPAPETSDDAPDAAEVERILERDIFAKTREEIPEVLPEGKLVIVGVRFRAGGKTYFFAPGQFTCKVGQFAIVETARGLEFGEVCIANRMVDESMVVPPLRPVIRIASEEDIAHHKENHAKEEAAYPIGVQKIAEHKLDMKLVSIQYTFDNSKLLFYYTSAGRVDFRELVKDLAGVFHVRIEMRQIGIRDESRMIGGLGACGRPLCCSTFLNDFGQVSMKMAKEQNLSLNSSKISGCCGRLMCCLRYEYDTYVEEIRRTPAQGTFVNTPDGPGVVTEIYPLQGEVKVSLRNQPDSSPKRYKRDLVEVQVRTPRAEESVSEPDSDE